MNYADDYKKFRGEHTHIDSSGCFVCPLGSECQKPNAGEVFDVMLEALQSVHDNWSGNLTDSMRLVNQAILTAKGKS